MTYEGFLSQIDKKGALVIGEPKEVAEKIKRHSEALGGLSRFTFQIDNPGLTNNDLMDSYELIGIPTNFKGIPGNIRGISKGFPGVPRNA